MGSWLWKTNKVAKRKKNLSWVNCILNVWINRKMKNKQASCFRRALIKLLWKFCILVAYRFLVSILVVNVGQNKIDAPYTIPEEHGVPVLSKLVYLQKKKRFKSKTVLLSYTTTWALKFRELTYHNEQMRHDACDFYQLWGSLIFSRWQNPKQWCETVSGSDAHEAYCINHCSAQGSECRTRNLLPSKTSSH